MSQSDTARVPGGEHQPSGLGLFSGMVAAAALVAASLVLLGGLVKGIGAASHLYVWGWAVLLASLSLLVQSPVCPRQLHTLTRRFLGRILALLVGCAGLLLLNFAARADDAIAFFLLAAALAAIDWETPGGRRPSQFLALALSLIALGELVALIAGPGIQSLFDLAQAAGRLALLALALATAAARPERGVMAAVNCDTLGGSLLRRFLPLAFGGPVIMAILVGSGERAHWYGPGRDEALLAIAGIFVCGAVVWLESQRMDASLARQRQLEERVRHAEKMESVGQLAAGVAHDFNNLLAGILNFSEALRRDLAEEDPKQDVINEIITAADSAAALTQQLLVFSGKQMLAPQVINLNQVVANNELLVRSVAGPRIQVKLALTPRLPTTSVDPQQMQRVLLNLVLNARDAMPHGGRVLIETGQCGPGDDPLVRHPELSAGHYVMLAVDDSGPGVAPQDRTRIFEPFFTTKDVSKGTGLGLSTAYGIVTQSGGQIFLAPKSSPGARLEIYLPVVAAEPEPRVRPEPASAPLPALATILVVEDNEIVQRAIRATLSAVGYHLLLASTPEEAMRVSRSHPGAIDLLLTDVVLPGASGTAVARRVTHHRRDIKVLFMSGYNQDETLRVQLCEGRAAFLKKPFRPSELMAAVQVALGIHAEAQPSAQ